MKENRTKIHTLQEWQLSILARKQTKWMWERFPIFVAEWCPQWIRKNHPEIHEELIPEEYEKFIYKKFKGDKQFRTTIVSLQEIQLLAIIKKEKEKCINWIWENWPFVVIRYWPKWVKKNHPEFLQELIPEEFEEIIKIED